MEVSSIYSYSERINKIRDKADIIDQTIANNRDLFLLQTSETDSSYLKEIKDDLDRLYDTQGHIQESKILDLEIKVACSAKTVTDILVFEDRMTSKNIKLVKSLNQYVKKQFPLLSEEMAISQNFESKYFIEQRGIGSCDLLSKLMIVQSSLHHSIYIKGDRIIFLNSKLKASKLKLDQMKTKYGYDVVVNEQGFINTIILNNDLIKQKEVTNQYGEQFTISNNTNTKIIVNVLEEIFNPRNRVVSINHSAKAHLIVSSILISIVIISIIHGILAVFLPWLLALLALSLPIYFIALTLTRYFGGYVPVSDSINNLLGIKEQDIGFNMMLKIIDSIPEKIPLDHPQIILGYYRHAYVVRGKKEIKGKAYLVLENPHGYLQLIKLRRKDILTSSLNIISYNPEQSINDIFLASKSNSNINRQNPEMFFKVPKNLDNNFTGIKFAEYLYCKGKLIGKINMYEGLSYYLSETLRSWNQNQDMKQVIEALKQYGFGNELIKFMNCETDELDFALDDSFLKQDIISKEQILKKYYEKICRMFHVFRDIYKKHNLSDSVQDDFYINYNG